MSSNAFIIFIQFNRDMSQLSGMRQGDETSLYIEHIQKVAKYWIFQGLQWH